MEQVKTTTQPKRKILLNMGKAFLVGGLICAFAQVIIVILQNFGVEKETANTVTVIIMVFLGALLTGFGIYDKIGQFAGQGTIVPITGFANSMTSSAIEYRSEGIFLGILTNMFKLAGSVIATGIISAFIFASLRYLLGLI